MPPKRAASAAASAAAETDMTDVDDHNGAATDKKQRVDHHSGGGAAAAEEKIQWEDEQKSESVRLKANSNQALGIAQFAREFLFGKKWKGPDAVHRPYGCVRCAHPSHLPPPPRRCCGVQSVFARVEQFHTDSVVCGLSALALRTNAPSVLRAEALDYALPVTSKLNGAYVFGSKERVPAEKAIAANVAAVREWDSNGTVFGYNEKLNHKAGEFGHNDFYPGTQHHTSQSLVTRARTTHLPTVLPVMKTHYQDQIYLSFADEANNYHLNGTHSHSTHHTARTTRPHPPHSHRGVSR
jgi:hypothetical protein